ncbi:L,D-transpeptidase family protein [Nonomuraea jabiensis]|uniref:Lipoprotein-anchoring transpeptidase ErfK/SrfK n=1 Tax=Nonomuraea jabiensis TaxID=882448 RepID=A0A7W9LBG5_9ACTN|nr:L,D-transpeptidase family protein [Nonomuraea jabiensis]MBB5777478.1 lipoprotein-anchoring transpeptidase ErfK/SrfK [Nonomuraea jabiensis]
MAALAAGCFLPLLAAAPAFADEPSPGDTGVQTDTGIPAVQAVPDVMPVPAVEAEPEAVKVVKPVPAVKGVRGARAGKIGVLRPGDRGEAVRLLQRRLHDGGFYFGPAHGIYDDQTRYAVWGLHKSRGMVPRGEVGPKTWAALRRSKSLRPLVPQGGADRVEISLTHQLLTVYRDNRPALVTHISTGAEVQYCEKGHCGNAVTPVGDFRVTRKAPGWTTSRLGSMYNSLYFVGGIAMHGSTEVPLRPASHGCVRMPLSTSVRVYNMVKEGEPVYVRGQI